MAFSTAAKAGVAGTLATAGSGLTATYLAWDHITLYEVEREVINKDLKLVVEENSTTNTINVKATGSDSSESIKLEKNHSWSCKITVAGAATGSGTNSIKDLASRIRDNLPTSDAKIEHWDKINKNHTKSKIKEALVKVCSEKKEGTYSNDSVVGTLTLEKEETTNNYKFKDHSKLDSLVTTNLKMVEREVIEKDVKLEVPAVTSGKTITVTAKTNGSNSLTDSWSWTCEISVTQEGENVESSLTTSLGNNLPKDSTVKKEQRINKELLVRACSETKKTGATLSDTSVTGTLTLVKAGSNYTFTNHSDLDYLLKMSS